MAQLWAPNMSSAKSLGGLWKIGIDFDLKETWKVLFQGTTVNSKRGKNTH